MKRLFNNSNKLIQNIFHMIWTDFCIEYNASIIANPRQYKIADWFLNRQKDIKDGKYSQVTSNALENKLREDLERLKKIRAHRGLRHYWGLGLLLILIFFYKSIHLLMTKIWFICFSLRVRGQHTKTTGRRGRTVGVSKKKN